MTGARRLLSALLAALALLAAPVVAAQTTPEAAAEAFLDKLPSELGGVAKPERRPNSPVMYFGKNFGRDPMIMAMAGPVGTPSDWLRSQENIRGAFHETGLRQVLREGSFTMPGAPGAFTFYGEYLTNMGIKQCWEFEHEGVRFNMIVTIFRGADRDKLREEVAAKVFGGATITDGPPPPAPAAAD